MTTRRTIAVAISAAVLVVAGIALLAPSRRGAPAFRLVPGSSRAYDLSFTTLVASGGAAPRETVLEGRLNVRVIPGEGGGAALAAQLDPLRVRVDGEAKPDMERRFAAPFVVAIGPRGQLGASRFPPELAPGDRAALDATLRAFQVILPPAPRDAWEEAETDPVGTFVAAYRLGERAGAIEKRKAKYTSVHPPTLFAVQVLASSVHAEVDAGGPWLARAEGSERLRFAPPGGEALATTETRFRLEPAGSPDRSAAIWRDDVLRAVRVPLDAPGTASSAWDDAERETARRRFVERHVTLDQLVARARTSQVPDAAFAKELAAFVRVFPDAAARIPPALPGGNGAASALLLHGLELAGTPEAQVALSDVAESSAQSRDDRLRAIFALGGVEAPTAATLERLALDARAAGAGDRSGFGSSALLALGALAGRAPGEAGAQVVSDLAADLRGTRDPERERLLLLALQNASAALPEDALAPHLASPDPRVREAAAGLARFADGGDPTGYLVGALAREPDAQVRARIVQALLARPADPRANAAIASALADGREPAAAVRAQMVGYLRQQLPAFPANREVLRASLGRESDRTVTIAILNALAI